MGGRDRDVAVVGGDHTGGPGGYGLGSSGGPEAAEALVSIAKDGVSEADAYSRWHTVARLRAGRALLAFHPVSRVAHRVGYASPSAFVAAFAKEFGCTPGSVTTRTGGPDGGSPANR